MDDVTRRFKPCFPADRVSEDTLKDAKSDAETLNKLEKMLDSLHSSGRTWLPIMLQMMTGGEYHQIHFFNSKIANELLLERLIHWYKDHLLDDGCEICKNHLTTVERKERERAYAKETPLFKTLERHGVDVEKAINFLGDKVKVIGASMEDGIRKILEEISDNPDAMRNLAKAIKAEEGLSEKPTPTSMN